MSVLCANRFIEDVLHNANNNNQPVVRQDVGSTSWSPEKDAASGFKFFSNISAVEESFISTYANLTTSIVV